MTSSVPPPLPSTMRPSRRLVAHDVKLTRQENARGETEVLATVQCKNARNVCDCLRCERFVRIEPHEAGFVLLCKPVEETTHEREPAEETE